MKLTIFDNYHAGVSLLPEEEQDAFYGAMARYAFEGVEPDLEGVGAAIWATIKTLVDKSLEGQANGAKGGDGRGNKKAENPSGKPTRKTPSENPSGKPSGKTASENPSEKPRAKTQGENQKKRKEGKGNGKNNPEDCFSIPPVATDGAESARAAPPSAPDCPSCGGGMMGTNSHRGGKKLFLCPECMEEVWVE